MENVPLLRSVTVAYGRADAQLVVPLQIAKGSTIKMAIEQAGILTQFPEIDLAVNKVGIFGKLKPLDAILEDGDRVEIYRSLLVDPKQARLSRLKVTA